MPAPRPVMPAVWWWSWSTGSRCISRRRTGSRGGRCSPRTRPAGRHRQARLPAGRAARRPHRAGARRAGRRHQPLGLIFPSPTGKHWRSSNFSRNVLKPAYRAIGWRDADGNGAWTWHSLRHVFCTTALFGWKLDATDVSRMAGHATYRTTLDMYVGTTAGVLDRARTATQ
jgi:integrase